MGAASAAADHTKDVNARYHDAAAGSFNSKWLVDFGDAGQRTVRTKVSAALGYWPERPFGDGLEIGAGTGYFTLNLVQLGAIERATASDISEGMLAEPRHTASRLDIEVRTKRSDGEELPFADGSFDLVFGHAILHHLPNPKRAFAELHRVLRPGGTIFFCGEPSRYGSLPARLAMRVAFAVSPAWRRLLRIPPRKGAGGGGGGALAPEIDALEPEIDVHTFSPRQLRDAIGAAGFGSIRIRGEGLLASLWGWALRGLYSTADPAHVPSRWRRASLGVLRATQRLDSAMFEQVVPPTLLYDLVISARKPGRSRP